ncbi:hypothetical protein BHE74_00017845 [Ensete ventricosum]|nr:hypothetical protein GW17_00010040 [Ensete ventricosum]RWW74215.1 hypothetical protein BHE74_00017845 [Ensete ventricosum]RZR84244.1 hypothetical protein BHM03_00011011 [Ensete ventricosum]
MKGPLKISKIENFTINDNIPLDTKYSYTTETYHLIKICPKSSSFPLPQPSFKYFNK